MCALFGCGVIKLAFGVFVGGAVFVVVIIVCFAGSVSFGILFWWSSGRAAPIRLGWFGFLLVLPVGGYGHVGFLIVVFVRFCFSAFVVRRWECGGVLCVCCWGRCIYLPVRQVRGFG